MELCCKELNQFYESMKGLYLSTGDGEISGSVMLETTDKTISLEISDGWNFIPSLKFNYCNFCGSKL